MKLEKIRERMEEEAIDCLILTDKHNIFYAIGKEIPGYLFLTQDSLEIIASKFFGHDLKDFETSFASSREEYRELLEKKSEKYEGKVATDAEEPDKLEELFDAENTELIQELREVKDEDEIKKIRKACEITDEAFQQLKPEIFSGITEWEAVSVLQQHYAEKGVPEAFRLNESQSLVQRNCMRPHRDPTGEKVKEDDLVIVDTGARYEGYCADVTRTYCKNPSEEQRELFEAVKEIQEELMQMIEPNVAIADLVEKGEELVEEKGYSVEENVLYPPGHGVGIEVHEQPRLGKDTDEEFKEGMVVAIEPGVHVPGIGGVRIEDTVLVTSEGAERLSNVPRKLDPEK